MNVLVAPPVIDELIYSALARARRRSRYSTLKFSEELFSEARLIVSPLFGLRLDRVAKCLRERSAWKKNVDKLRDQHTLTPLAVQFMTAESRAKCVAAIQCDQPNGRHLSALYRGLQTSRNRRLRYCAECRNDDLNDNDREGEACWYRVHQIEGLKICPHHLIPLTETSVTAHPRLYVALDEVVRGVPIRLSNKARVIQERISGEILSLLKCPLPTVDRQQLAAVYRAEMVRRGAWVGKPWRLAEDLRKFFGKEALASVSPRFDDWIADFVARGNRLAIPVVVYAVLAARIDMTLAEFVHAANATPAIEHQPWPCMNPSCTDYRKLVIRTRNTGRSRNAPTWTFMCPTCHARYARPFPLTKNKDGSFEHTLLTRSEQWFERFDAAWQSPRQTWSMLEREFRLSPTRIGQIAAQRGLPNVPEAHRTIDCHRKSTPVFREERSLRIRLARRAEWQTLADAPRLDAAGRRRLMRLRELLLIYDRSWVEGAGIKPSRGDDGHFARPSNRSGAPTPPNGKHK